MFCTWGFFTPSLLAWPLYRMLVQTGAALMLSPPLLNLLDIHLKVGMPVESVRHWAATRLAFSLLSCF